MKRSRRESNGKTKNGTCFFELQFEGILALVLAVFVEDFECLEKLL